MAWNWGQADWSPFAMGSCLTHSDALAAQVGTFGCFITAGKGLHLRKVAAVLNSGSLKSANPRALRVENARAAGQEAERYGLAKARVVLASFGNHCLAARQHSVNV